MDHSRKDLKASLLLLLAVYYIGTYHTARSLPFHESGLIGGMNYNLIVYAVSLLGAFILSWIWMQVGERFLDSVKGGFSLLLSVPFLIAAPSTMFFLWQVYKNESSTPAADMIKVHFLREHFPHLLVTAVMTVLIAGSFAAVKFTETETAEDRKWSALRMIGAFQLALVCGILNFGPNTFRNGLWGIFHNHAYTASIISVMSKAPYDAVNTNIYGHYGILYAPFVLLFGDDYKAIATTIALFTFFICFLAFLCASRIIRNHVLYFTTILAIAAINVTYYKPGQALAVMPHRYLFPMIALAYIFYLRSRISSPFVRTLADCLIGTLAIVFNLETGLGSTLTIAAVRFLDFDTGKSSSTDRKSGILLMLKRIGLQIIFCACCFFAAWGIVDLYNLAVGGDLLSFPLFIYPYGSHDYNINSELTLPLPTTKAAYTLHIVTFSYAVFSVLCRMMNRFVRPENSLSASEQEGTSFLTKADTRGIEAMSIGISGIISLSYFMNRTALGQISICHIHFILLLAMYSDSWLRKQDLSGVADCFSSTERSAGYMKAAMSAAAFYLVSWFAIEGIFSFGGAFESRISSIWDMQSLQNSLTEYRDTVPEDMLTFGLGMPEIDYSIGRKPQTILSEWSNTNRFSEEKIKDCLNQTDAFAMTDDTRFEVPSDFIPAGKLDSEDFRITVYRRK